MSLDIKDLQEKYNLFDTDGKLIVANLIKCLNFVYSHLGDSVKANDEGDLEVGRNLEVDGNATINSELELGESGDIGANLSNAIATSLQGNFTKLYKHTCSSSMSGLNIVFVSTSATPLTGEQLLGGAFEPISYLPYNLVTILAHTGRYGATQCNFAYLAHNRTTIDFYTFDIGTDFTDTVSSL